MSLETVPSFVIKFPVMRNSNMADGVKRGVDGIKKKKKRTDTLQLGLISHTSFLEERKYANLVQASFVVY
jgi:hypothetical protein